MQDCSQTYHSKKIEIEIDDANDLRWVAGGGGAFQYYIKNCINNIPKLR